MKNYFYNFNLLLVQVMEGVKHLETGDINSVLKLDKATEMTQTTLIFILSLFILQSLFRHKQSLTLFIFSSAIFHGNRRRRQHCYSVSFSKY